MTTRSPLSEVRLEPLARVVEHFTNEYGDTEHFDLAAPYQRGSVWTEDQRRALIKSIVMGLPVGAIITSQVPYYQGGPSYRVVDGKQRIETLRAFVANELVVPGWWFTDDDCADRDSATTFDGLTRRGQLHFSHQSMPELLFRGEIEFTSTGTRHRTAAEVLVAEAELYGLINGAGTAQTDEDMARAAAVARGGA